ncbi:DUF1549 domain-containing protein [Schlesneria sp. DSM 10557]|uniref:DUF1549 domain-containing protein n=1 Tax=Schlesneria sp. DSM 10557 TaxID=3044399 RepID=UPI0035A192BF
MKKRFTLRLLALMGFCCYAASTGAAEVSFRNDVMAVLSKAGCNLGTCHGNARGKGGFQISLRGQDPDADFEVLTRELFGRRVNSLDPDQSLMLLKPTMQMAHEGGKRFSTESQEYQILRNWIAAGMPRDTRQTPQLLRLRVLPESVFLPEQRTSSSPGWQQQIEVIAEFSDGSAKDVSSLAVYELSQPIADVSREGLVTGHAAGEVTVIVRYLDLQSIVRIAFLPDRPDFVWTGPDPANFIDVQVFDKLKQLKISPSPVCDDATFIRRVTLDLLGIPPTAQEAQRFVDNTTENKRAVLIDSLLERPEFSDWWALKWSDLLRIEEKTLDRKGVENFYSWLRESFATHKPLDQLVREIVAAQGSTYEVPPANFYRALRTPFERSEAVGQLFLGVRLQCSKCHNHPFDQWTQDDYYSWGSVFSRVNYKILENRRRDSNDQHEFDGEQIVYLSEKGEAKDPRTNRSRDAKFLGSREQLPAADHPLLHLSQWLTDQQHERFVQMLANRTWQQVMGRGIVDPIDDFRATNPPSNPALLKAISEYLVSGKTPGSESNPGGAIPSSDLTAQIPAFDLRRLLRAILNSRTYQLSSTINETNRDDESNFSRAYVHRYSAEQLLDATSLMLQVPLEFSGYPPGRRAGQIPGINAMKTRENGLTEADRFLRLFGRPPRLQSCDCERSDESTLGQTFQLVSGSLVNRMLTAKSNRLSNLSGENNRPEQVITELYWSALTRPPTEEELAGITQFLNQSENKRTALEDIVWGLLNSHEFLLRR